MIHVYVILAVVLIMLGLTGWWMHSLLAWMKVVTKILGEDYG